MTDKRITSQTVERKLGQFIVALLLIFIAGLGYDIQLNQRIDANFRGINETACQAHATRVAQENWLRGR